MSTRSSPAAVHAVGLQKTYQLGFAGRTRVKALQELDLTIVPGEVFGLIGPNGAGKSTAIKILLNLVQPSAGSATIFGHDVRNRVSRIGLGYVPENPVPYEYLTGREFVTFSARLSGAPTANLTQQVGESLERVALTRAADLPIRRYSKGMTQRTVIAAALASQPRLLVLDEPTSGLDPIGRRLVRDVIIDERKKGTTVLFCTHIISDVETVCDRLAVLVGGKCVTTGTVSSLLSGQAPDVEVLVEGLSREALERLSGLTSITPVGERVLVCTSEANLNPLLAQIITAQGKVFRITPVRFSLEDLFIKTLNAAGNQVGGAID